MKDNDIVELIATLKVQRDALSAEIIRLANEHRHNKRQEALNNLSTLMGNIPWKLDVISVDQIEIYSYINDIVEQNNLLEVCDTLCIKEADVIRLPNYGADGTICGPNMVRTQYTQLCIMFNNPRNVSAFIREYKLNIVASNMDRIQSHISALQDIMKVIYECTMTKAIKEMT